MECEGNKVDLGCEPTESPCSALLERLKNLRKWQDEQCKELRAGQFLRSDQTSALENKTNELNLSPELSAVMSRALVGEDGNKNTLERNLVSSDSKFLEDMVAKQNLSVTRNRYSLENSYVTCGESQESYGNSSENQTITQSSDKEELSYEHVPKESNDCKESPKFNFASIKYENDDMRKFRGLSSFIKNHASMGDAANSHDSGIADYLESAPKPKFKFLRKGEGTSRFGMKQVRIKPRICKNELKSVSSILKFNEEKKSNANAKISTESSCAGNGIPKYPKPKYVSKINNKPLKMLKLGGVKNMVSNVSTEEHDTVRQNEKPDETSPERFVTCSDMQQVFPSDITDYDKQGRKEQEELSAFEKLEELAEDSSFSSNCSAVVQLLRRGLHSASSTPVRSRQSTPQLTSILGSEDHRRNVDFQNSVEENSLNQSDIVLNEVCLDQFPLVNVSQILEQLKGIVRLKHSEESSLSQEEIRTLIESYIDPDTVPSEFASYFAANMKHSACYPTSTPAVVHQSLTSRPRVHFRPEGVEVLEYECTDSDDENTLTDTPSIVDDTDLITTSELEILAHIDEKRNFLVASMDKRASTDRIQILPDDMDSSCTQSTPKLSQGMCESGNRECLQPIKLQFSPPQRPQNSASHYIWSIFGKNRDMQNGVQPRNERVELTKSGSHSSKSGKNVKEKETETVSIQMSCGDKTPQEVETYKALLMAKVCELEKETDLFKRENHKLQTLQKNLQNEKSQLDTERKNLQLEMEREKKRFREYVDSERNKLWKEKQALKVQQPSVSAVREQSLETVYLKEQLLDAKEEIGKKESLHQFTVKKLNEKIKILEEEIKLLKEKNSNLQKLEKENMHLKHEVDRTRLTGKTLPKSKPKTNTSGNAKCKVKRATINSINKSLDKVAAGDNLTTTKPVSRGPPAVHVVEISEKFNNRSPQENPQPVDVNAGSNSNLANEIYGIFPGNKRKENIVHDFQHSLVISDQESSGRPQIMEVKDSLRSLECIAIDCTELCRDDGSKEIIYANGNKKEVLSDGSVIVSYYNGDRKEIFKDKTVYIYGTDSTRHTTYIDGKEILEFPNGQKETRFPDGSSEIIFTDNTRKASLPDGTEICVIKDGTVVRTNPDGIKVFEFVSGQKEIHTPEEKRREYPDGTVKILHQDGRTETRYKKGRVRIKDKEGNIITDTHQSVQ